MALLTASVPSAPGQMTALIELLLVSPNFTQKEKRVQELLTLGENPNEDAWKYAIQAASCFALVEKDSEQNVSLTKDVQNLKSNDLVYHLPQIALHNFLDRNWSSKDFTDEDQNKENGADLAIGMAWLLAQNPWTPFPLTNDRLEKLHLEQFDLDKAPGLISSTRLPAILRWSHYFGLAYYDPFSTSHAIPEPSKAICRLLTDFPKGFITASKFFKDLAKKLPVLDGGTLRKNTFKNLNENRLPEEKESKSISTILSVSILRLVEQGYISIEYENDSARSDQMDLLLPEGPKTISRVKVKKHD